MAHILAEQGHPWVVMQSLHLICGHEFDRLISERENADIRSSIGLPLLTSHMDYKKTATALAPLFPKKKTRLSSLWDTAQIIRPGHPTRPLKLLSKNNMAAAYSWV